MSHLLETYGDMATFASLREVPWHGLGTVFENEVTTSEMLKLAHLDNWNVRLEPLNTTGRYHKTAFEVVRDNPFDNELDTLGIVGERYAVSQNEELFSFGDNILDGGRWETAGSIKNGTVVFGSLALDRKLLLDPKGIGDAVDTYLLVHTSHDGSLAIQASVTPVRVVCNNTFTMAVGARGKGAKQSFRIRHTQTVQGKVQAAREALGLANQYLDEFDKIAQEMIQKEIDNNLVYDIFEAVYPKPENDIKGAMTKWDNKITTLWNIYESDTVKDIQKTAWGVYNTLTERLDWYRNPRGGNAENILASASGFDAVTNAEKSRILKIVREMALAK